MTSRELVRLKSAEVGLIDRMPGAAVQMAPPVGIRSMLVWLWLVGIGLFAALAAWASVATLQSAVVASGQVHVLGDRLVVQHLEGGIVRDIAVREGDVVQQGQVLLTLDDTMGKATVDMLTNQLVSALSTQARLQAEFDGQAEVKVSAELAGLLALNPSFSAMLDTQTDLLASNRRLSEGQIAILQERISQLSEQKNGLEQRLAAQTQQLALAREEVSARAALLEKGYTTKTEVLAMRRDEVGLEGNVAVTQSQLQGVLEQISEIEARKLQVRRDDLKTITAARQQINETVFEMRQRLSAAQDVLDRLTIRAPCNGQIVGLVVNTPGSVIGAGQKLMDIVPDGATQVVQVRVSPDDINQVGIGGAARVRLTAYNTRTTPIVGGMVTEVSADSLTDPATRLAYFEVVVRLDPTEVAALKNVKLMPGMPVQVMIATGEQTVSDYLLDPVLGSLEKAMVENE